MITTCLKERSQAVQLAVCVKPRASRNQILAIRDGELCLRLTSPPVDGAANALCRDTLAKTFGLPKGAVTLVAGERSRHKRWLLDGLTLDEAVDRLERVLPPEALDNL